MRVALQPYDKPSLRAMRTVQAAIRREFGIESVVLPVRKLPQSAWYAPRGRWRADKLLQDLSSIKGYDRVLGLTASDISTTLGDHKDWGVFGLGQMPGKACILSTFRLNRRVERVSPTERLKRVAYHELGHTLGLRHCSSRPCLMNDAEGSIKSVDATNRFCESCSRRLGRS